MGAPQTVRQVTVPHEVELRILLNHLSEVIRGATGDRETSLVSRPEYEFDRSAIAGWLDRHGIHGSQLTRVMEGLVRGNVIVEVRRGTFRVTSDALEVYERTLRE